MNYEAPVPHSLERYAEVVDIDGFKCAPNFDNTIHGWKTLRQWWDSGFPGVVREQAIKAMVDRIHPWPTTKRLADILPHHEAWHAERRMIELVM